MLMQYTEVLKTLAVQEKINLKNVHVIVTWSSDVPVGSHSLENFMEHR